MLNLIRTTIIPWIAALTVSLTGVALGGDVVAPQPQVKRIRKVIVMPDGQPAPHAATDTIAPRHDFLLTQPRAGYWQPGGYEGRIGSPYYYSIPGGYGAAVHGPRYHDAGSHACQCGRERHRHGFHHQHGSRRHPAFGYHYGHARGFVTDPYSYHFGPGYYRQFEHGHYRFPYYSYRRPWYYPGQPVFNRDTNFAW